VQVDDTIGGFVVTSYPHPMSEHDFRKDGDPTKRGEVAAECRSEPMAQRIAGLLNASEPVPARLG
jgi:hypothetical protein